MVLEGCDYKGSRRDLEVHQSSIKVLSVRFLDGSTRHLESMGSKRDL